MRRGLLSSTWRSFLHLFGLRTHYSLAVPLLCCKCEGQVGWNQNFEFLLTGVSGEPEAACLNEQVRRKEREQREPRVWGRERSEWRRKTYIHGNVPGHVDVGFVFIHPHLSGTQGIAFSVVIYVIVIGLLGALDVSHSGTWEDFHTPTALPHLDSSRESTFQRKADSYRNVFIELFFNILYRQEGGGCCASVTPHYKMWWGRAHSSSTGRYFSKWKLQPQPFFLFTIFSPKRQSTEGRCVLQSLFMTAH